MREIVYSGYSFAQGYTHFLEAPASTNGTTKLRRLDTEGSAGQNESLRLYLPGYKGDGKDPLTMVVHPN